MKINSRKKEFRLLFIIISFVFILLFISLWDFIFNNKNKEGFKEGFKEEFREGFTWSDDSTRDFLIFQNTVNPNTQFDLEVIKKQASEDELKYLFKNNKWPWSNETSNLYLEATEHNSIIKRSPQASLDYVQKIYNENAAKQLISWNTDEGKFLLNGVQLQDGNIVQCEIDNNGNSVMKKTIIDGVNLWNGYPNIEKITLQNDQIPKEIPGFQFLKGNCNPCSALDNNYNCPFEIKLKQEKNQINQINNEIGISKIWKSLWNI